ncbi:MAG TPA: hypothetical protein VLA45_05575 [Paracoccaceae bacterium]|nr:hypothetical protein [Paracoccaceae bacterium]
MAVPTVAGLARWRWQHGSHTGLVHDASLAAGTRFALAGAAAGRPSVQVHGDTIRFARDLVATRPSLIAGVTRHADALLIAEVAAEAGYVLAAELRGDAKGCTGNSCDGSFVALTRMAVGAGGLWAEAFATWAANPQGTTVPQASSPGWFTDRDLALGWLLVPRG